MVTTVEGLPQLERDFDRFIDDKLEELAKWTKDELDGVMDVSKKLVPVKFGDLRDSGYVGEPVVIGNSYSVEIGYSEKYAVPQHERLDYVHRTGQAKFLEQPLNEWASDVLGL